MDALQYNSQPPKHVTQQAYDGFVRGLSVMMANKLSEIFKANLQTNVHLRAATNAMLVLNKIKTVSSL